MKNQDDFNEEILANAKQFESVHENDERQEQNEEDFGWTPFPVNILPEAIKLFVNEASESIGCDPVLAVNPLLAVCAGAIGNTRTVALKSDYYEPSILWAVSIAPSGEKKTPPFEMIRKLFDKHEQDADRKYQEEKQQYDLAYKSFSRRKNKEEENAMKKILARPIKRRFILNDITVEGVALLLSQNPRGLTIMCDEFSGWYERFNSYKKGNGDESFYLQAFQGTSYSVDRKNEESNVYIPRCSLSITGGIQPEVFKSFLRRRQNIANGMAARFLIAMPPTRVALWSENCVNANTIRQMQSVIDKLLAMELRLDENGNSVPQTILLDEKAKALFVEMADSFAVETQEMSEALRSLWSKMAGRIARIALVFHCIRSAGEEEIEDFVIDERTMQSAIEVGRWYANEAKRCYSFFDIGSNTTVSINMEEDILNLVAQTGQNGITKRDLNRRRPRYFREQPKVLEGLVKRGILSSVEIKNNGPGAPKTVYRLHQDDILTDLTE